MLGTQGYPPMPLSGRHGVGGIFNAQGCDEDSVSHPASQHMALRMLCRRFGLLPATAAMVAEIVGLGATQ